MKKPVLTLKVSGDCSIAGVVLAEDLKKFFEKYGFKNIKIKGNTDTDRYKYGSDGFTEDETVEIIFNLK